MHVSVCVCGGGVLWVADTWLPYCHIMGVYGADEQGSWWAGGEEQVVYRGEMLQECNVVCRAEAPKNINFLTSHLCCRTSTVWDM